MAPRTRAMRLPARDFERSKISATRAAWSVPKSAPNSAIDDEHHVVHAGGDELCGVLGVRDVMLLEHVNTARVQECQ